MKILRRLLHIKLTTRGWTMEGNTPPYETMECREAYSQSALTCHLCTLSGCLPVPSWDSSVLYRISHDSLVSTVPRQWHLLLWGPIYKESYARLMRAQHLRRTYAELVNCERLTKNHKLNLQKIYSKLTQNLRKTYDHINAVISQS